METYPAPCLFHRVDDVIHPFSIGCSEADYAFQLRVAEFECHVLDLGRQPAITRVAKWERTLTSTSYLQSRC